MRPMTKTMKLMVFALAASVVAASAPAAAADYYLKLGPVKGESATAAKGRENKVEVLSWSWGASQSSHAGGGMGAGKVNMQDMSVMRTTPVPADYDGDGRADGAAAAGDIATEKRTHHPVQTVMTEPPPRGSVTLVGKFPACTVGAAYKDALLQVAGLRYKLEEVVITSCTAAPGGGEPTQSLSLNYTKIKLD